MSNKVPSYTTETEQRRLTLSTRLALGASRFSDEVVEYLMQNENQDEIPEILGAVACLGRDQRFALVKVAEQGTLGTAEMVLPSEWAHAGERFWQDEYGIKADFAGLKIPSAPLNTAIPHIFILMAEKASQSPEFLFQSDKKVYGGKVWKFTDKSLNELEMTHEFTGTFGSWVADEQEAPDGYIGGINLNTAAVDELNRIAPGSWNTETLPMRQVHGRVHWRQHKMHLDQDVITFCQASRLPDGAVPRVRFSRGCGWVCVGADAPQRADDDVRFRRAVVSKPQT